MSKQNKQSSFEKYYLSNLDINYIASDLDRIERQRKAVFLRIILSVRIFFVTLSLK